MRSVVPVIVLLASCETGAGLGPSDNPTRIADTSGASFAWDCDDGGCAPRAEDPQPVLPACAEGEQPVFAYTAGRFVVIAAACRDDQGWVSFGNWQRPVACAVDADCPQVFELERDYAFECRNGICQNVDVEAYPETVIRLDAWRLCYGPFPREATLEPGTSIGIQVTEWVESACGDLWDSPCTTPLPGECLQP